MGIVHKVATEDASFDKKFLIFSNDPTQAMTYFSSGTVKNVIKELFDSGFNEVLVNGKEILIQKEDYIPEKDLEPEFITGILQNLTLLSRTL